MGTNARVSAKRAVPGVIALVIGIPVAIVALATLGAGESATAAVVQFMVLGFLVWVSVRTARLSASSTEYRWLGVRESILPGVIGLLLIFVVVFGGAFLIRFASN